MAENAIAIRGLRELQRSFAVADKEMSKDLKSALSSAAEPVRSDAESMARVSIHQGAIPWHVMRTGVTRSSVYVAPKQRSTRNASRRRPNLANILLSEAMEPALEQNRGKVVQEVEDAIEDMAKAWARVG